MRPTAGQVFGSRYELISRIAIGGMGEVWKANDSVIGRTVAIKILKDEYMGDSGFRERFRAEARHAALVNHEGIANVFDYGEEEGSAYLVMELVPGEALSSIIEREKILPSSRVLSIVAQTASALHAAHQAGLVHRDIKPGNLLITPDGSVKITDFGIARLADQVPLTATGQVMGTVQYLAPEQAGGKPASPATDVYSLGIVAYEALAGKRPFRGESQVAIAMAQIKETPPELPSSIPSAVRALVMSCMAKKPEGRPASAHDLSQAALALSRGDDASALALIPAQETSEEPAKRTKPREATTDTGSVDHPRKLGRNFWLFSGIGGFVALALIATSLTVLLQSPSQDVIEDPIIPVAPEVVVPETPADEPAVIEKPDNPQITTVEITQAEIVGKTQSQVQETLTRKGLRLDAITGNIAPSQDLVATAYRVNPQGTVASDTLIAVYFYAAIPQPPKPRDLVVTPAVGPWGPGDDVLLEWPGYAQCPAGFDLTSYTIQIVGGTILDNNGATVLEPEQTAINVRLGTGETMKASYLVKCGTLSSPLSSEVTLGITTPDPDAPAEAPVE
ncbi:MAG: serine/threonine protein kinase [Microbacteriaceae bacterium]|jgi:eukaryotic-like serine/threonine-protein kinase|nr:serine/threonine protein kinase [Microbacteriaceae bacterium]